MVTKDIIDEQFIRQTINKGNQVIFDTQADVVSQHLNERSGRLAHFIGSRSFNVDGLRYSYPVLIYMRFLDIQAKRRKSERSGLALYNRVVWGVLYRQVQPTLRFGLTDEIRQQIKNQLLSATGTEKNV
jgi:hypothetical protein